MSTIRSLLQESYKTLAHLDTALLDSEILLSFVLRQPREYILAHAEDEAAADKAKQFYALIARRAKHEPIAYLIRQKEFYGRNFFVDSSVHIPRPATEDLIDYAKDNVTADFNGTFADIGAGSGCIAITLAHEFPHAKIIATDISQDALDVAQRNARDHNIAERIDFRLGDLFEPLTEPVDIIVSNPPYGWPQATQSAKGEVWSNDPEVLFQPAISYESGADGLDIIRRFISELPDYLAQNGQAFMKFDPRRKDEVCALLEQSPFIYTIKKDLAGFDRIARLTRQ
ncbi:MAG: protein-(glutamine-N5) methyltransferase, release factor-specific [Candidatus Komeilibacteria bacterium RIFCSPLOWO2_02_FULL_48_11]|uniref:peptide chain release factor N(5)-glutamine methyltransferase n=1 Tax=Candidatus Komeilibacteria bacterium RIFCSPLOWO2_02_FULL_48_11 TaxID=1798553 RepID=A0A1G2BQS3_9BACT|nr:MAG: protein-(glutamine-N5) methyltransferase, release factor-specific [Candidatus Komeilibacteria bacterium RIFCSPLOWO2_02_FULL_48_11]